MLIFVFHAITDFKTGGTMGGGGGSKRSVCFLIQPLELRDRAKLNYPYNRKSWHSHLRLVTIRIMTSTSLLKFLSAVRSGNSTE